MTEALAWTKIAQAIDVSRRATGRHITPCSPGSRCGLTCLIDRMVLPRHLADRMKRRLGHTDDHSTKPAHEMFFSMTRKGYEARKRAALLFAERFR